MDEAIQLQLSEARTAYLEAAANDDIEDKELRSLGAAVVELEKRLQADIKEQQSKDKEAKEPVAGASDKELPPVELRNYLAAAVEGRSVAGAEKELLEEKKLSSYDGIIPFEALLPRNIEHRADASIKVAAAIASNQQGILPRVFNRTVGTFLGVAMPMLARGDATYPVLTDGNAAAISGRSGRLICISIRGDSPMLSELSKRKDQSGVVWHEYAATAGCDYMDKKQWHKANPGLRSKIKSIEYMKHTALRAKSSPSDAPTFLAYDLNLPQSPTRETIVSFNDYSRCVVGFNELPERSGPVFVGIDLGGSSSMTAAVFYWPDTGRTECVGAFGNKPGLKQRGQSDGVGSLYEQMHAKGELKVYEGYATPVKHLIKDIALMLEGQQVAGVACDRYRKSEFLDALYGARVPWGNAIEFRGQGSSMVFTADGAYDVRSFQVAVLERRIKVCRSLLLEHSIANSSISRDAAGNCKLDRATQRGRIDTLQAGVLALGLGARYRERNAGGGAKLKLHII